LAPLTPPPLSPRQKSRPRSDPPNQALEASSGDTTRRNESREKTVWILRRVVERVVSSDLRARVAFGGAFVEGDTCDSEVGWEAEEE